LERLRFGHGVDDLVVLAGEGGAWLGPERADDREGFLEAVGAVAGGAEGEAEHGVLVLGPARADAELDPATGEVVDRHGRLGEYGGVPVGVAGD
jgi:hypothetical protein